MWFSKNNYLPKNQNLAMSKNLSEKGSLLENFKDLDQANTEGLTPCACREAFDSVEPLSKWLKQ